MTRRRRSGQSGARPSHRAAAAALARPQHESTGTDHYHDDAYGQRCLAPWRPPRRPATSANVAGWLSLSLVLPLLPSRLVRPQLLAPALAAPRPAGCALSARPRLSRAALSRVVLRRAALSRAVLGWLGLGPAALRVAFGRLGLLPAVVRVQRLPRRRMRRFPVLLRPSRVPGILWLPRISGDPGAPEDLSKLVKVSPMPWFPRISRTPELLRTRGLERFSRIPVLLLVPGLLRIPRIAVFPRILVPWIAAACHGRPALSCRSTPGAKDRRVTSTKVPT